MESLMKCIRIWNTRNVVLVGCRMYELFLETSSEHPELLVPVRRFLSAASASLMACVIRSRTSPALARFCSCAAAPFLQLLRDDDLCRVRRVHLAMESGTCTWGSAGLGSPQHPHCLRVGIRWEHALESMPTQISRIGLCEMSLRFSRIIFVHTEL